MVLNWMEGEFELIILSLKELTHQHLEFIWVDQQSESKLYIFTKRFRLFTFSNICL